VAKELNHALPGEGPVAEDLKLLREQVERCRTILSKLTSLDRDGGGFLETISLSHLVEEIVEPHRSLGVPIEVVTGGEGPEPMGRRSPGVVYGLANIIDNAVDFAASRVVIEARWTSAEVRIQIRDDGPGYSPDVLLRVGEPYVTTRSGRRRAGSERGAARARPRPFHRQDLDRAVGRALAPQRGAPGTAVARSFGRALRLNGVRSPSGRVAGPLRRENVPI
jgi:two-component system sensor histidine kinase RegB